MEKINKEIEKAKRNKTKVPDDLNELAHNYAINKYTPRIAEFAKIHFIEGFKAAIESQPSEQKPPEGEEELEQPIGQFILDNAKGIQKEDGMYYHYSDVCHLIKKHSSIRTHSLEEENGDLVAELNRWKIGEYAQQSMKQERERAIQECIEIAWEENSIPVARKLENLKQSINKLLKL